MDLELNEDPMGALSTPLEDNDRALKPKEDVVISVDESIKRTYDEAFSEDPFEKSKPTEKPLWIPPSILALEEADPSHGWKREFERAMRDSEKRRSFEECLPRFHDPSSQIDKVTIPKAQKLPDDLMITIINLVASRGTKRQLANIALVSKRMYEIAIPKLYGCIEVTKLNEDELIYGCTLPPAAGSHVGGDEVAGRPTRKDLATSHTHTLILHDNPAKQVARCYRSVRHVRLSRWSRLAILTEDADMPRVDVCKTILEFLSVLAHDDISKSPLRVDISFNMAKYFAQIAEEGVIRPDVQSPKSIVYKIPYLNIDLARTKDLANVMALQPVVCLDVDSEISPPHEDYEHLIKRIRPCFTSGHRPTYPGRLFLSDVPAIAFSPEELEAAKDADAEALLKVYNAIIIDSQPTWEQFTSVIKLVEPEFWPSRDDLADGRRNIATTTIDDDNAP